MLAFADNETLCGLKFSWLRPRNLSSLLYPVKLWQVSVVGSRKPAMATYRGVVPSARPKKGPMKSGSCDLAIHMESLERDMMFLERPGIKMEK